MTEVLSACRKWTEWLVSIQRNSPSVDQWQWHRDRTGHCLCGSMSSVTAGRTLTRVLHELSHTRCALGADSVRPVQRLLAAISLKHIQPGVYGNEEWNDLAQAARTRPNLWWVP